MTLGEKISRERKALNYTQEQLAEILGVSRQSISKYESDIAYPETDKLIKLGKLFECSMDYLLVDDITDKNGHRDGSSDADSESSIREKADKVLNNACDFVVRQFRERRSEKVLCGMPLYHIGKDARGFFAIGYKARGVVAIGLKARGIISLGLLSIGLLSFGLLSIGLIAFGVLALGLLSVGTIALGLFAAGAVAVGIVSFGALAIGCFASGAGAIGQYIAVGDYARGMIAIGLNSTSTVDGSVYETVGGLSKVPISYVREWLDGNVPWYLGWAKEIFKLYLGN